jgi:hypothetical protein
MRRSRIILLVSDKTLGGGEAVKDAGVAGQAFEKRIAAISPFNLFFLFLIEAVHSSGPISSVRLMELKRLAKHCSAEIVFVTVFLNRDLPKILPGDCMGDGGLDR